MKYFKKLVGEKIYLSPPNEEDIETYTKWLNDFNTTDYIGASGKICTIEAEKDWYEKNSKKEDGATFAIIEAKTDKLIGSCSIDGINNISRTATLGIFIGDYVARNKGYGTEVIKLLLDFGFNYLNLHSIQLHVMAFNKIAIRCYEKCGFKEVGRRREAYYLNGKYYDIITMDILKKEFKEETIKNKNI